MKTYSVLALPVGGWMIYANGSPRPVLWIESQKELAAFKALMRRTYGEPARTPLGSEIASKQHANA